MLRRIVILSIILCLSMAAKSQDNANDEADNSVVDSLLREYAAAKSDTARARLCREIGYESDDPDTIIKYSTIGISLFDGKDSSNLAHLYGCKAWAYNRNGEDDSALTYNKQALELFDRFGNIEKMVLYSVNLSRCYRRTGDYTKMWNSMYEALRKAQQNADTVNICYCYYTIADFYNDLGMKQQGIEAATKAFQLARQSNNYGEMGADASILSLFYFSEDNDSLCRISIDWVHLALDCYDKADELDAFYAECQGDAILCLIDSYLKLACKEGNERFIDSVSYYIDKYDEYCTEFSIDDKKILVQANRAMLRYAMHDYQSAASQLLETLKNAQETGTTVYNKYLYEDLSKTYQKLGDYRRALKYYEMCRDSKESNSGARAMVEAAAFETKNKVEQEREVAEYEQLMADKELADRQSHFSRMIRVSLAVFVALLVFVFFIWRTLQNTRKGNEVLLSHNEEIKRQNDELDSEKAKLVDINNKIRQSMRYARRLQMATVSSEAEIEAVFPDALVYYKPCEIVSGDWYWTARLGSKRILALGGSAKIGVPGALVSMMTVNALKDTIGQLSAMSAVSPTAILRTVQSKLPEAARNNAAGLSLCVFGRGSVRYAGINQNAVLLKDGNTILMPCDKPGDMFHTVTEGDIVMLYSTATLHELSARSTTPEMLCSLLYQKSPVEQKGAIEEMMSEMEQKEDVSIVSIII
ncbi:MAG: tetratricopeptide repeat protein [Bacteroidales bacterium]|nr:tetratricopeptide repeat protein [Bacteroidales bacterium]